MVCVEFWEFFFLNLDIFVFDNFWYLFFILDWNDFFFDFVYSLLDCIDCWGRYDEVWGVWRLIKLKFCDVKFWVCWWMVIRWINCCFYRWIVFYGFEYIIMVLKRFFFMSYFYFWDGIFVEYVSLWYYFEDVFLFDMD